jgi:hypothetical protein
MSLESKTLDGSEKKIKRKPWRELKQSDLDERVRSIPAESIIETSMRSYDPVTIPALSQLKFNLYGAKRKGQSTLLNGNIHKGADMMYNELKDEIKILGEANVRLSAHPVESMSDEAVKEVVHLKFPNSPKKNLRLQQWVPELLDYVSECLNITTVGLYGMALCYSLCEEEAVSEDSREILSDNVKHFRKKIISREYKMKVLLDHIKNEEGNTGV